MSVRVNIFETLPINKISVPQLRGNDIEQNENSSKINLLTRIPNRLMQIKLQYVYVIIV